MKTNNFDLINIFIIFIITVYIVFGFFSYYFTLTTKRNEIEEAGLPSKILYWHGIIFVLAFIGIGTMLLFFKVFG